MTSRVYSQEEWHSYGAGILRRLGKAASGRELDAIITSLDLPKRDVTTDCLALDESSASDLAVLMSNLQPDDDLPPRTAKAYNEFIEQCIAGSGLGNLRYTIRINNEIFQIMVDEEQPRRFHYTTEIIYHTYCNSNPFHGSVPDVVVRVFTEMMNPVIVGYIRDEGTYQLIERATTKRIDFEHRMLDASLANSNKTADDREYCTSRVESFIEKLRSGLDAFRNELDCYVVKSK